MKEEAKANTPGMPGKTTSGQVKPGMPCFRCGRCCRYRVCLSYQEAQGIVSYTGLARDEFVEKYEEPGVFEEGYEDMYWLEADSSYLLRQRNGECFFLEHVSVKEAICRIHEVKPQVCQKYEPAPERLSCQKGLVTFWHLTTSTSGELQGTKEYLKAFRYFIESIQ